MVGDKKMYVFSLEATTEEDGDEADNSRTLSFPSDLIHAETYEANP